MPNAASSAPRLIHGAMVSSTFTDLKPHRAALRCSRLWGLAGVASENDSEKPEGDVIDSSLRMVRDASAYIGILSHKYGQAPRDREPHLDELSLDGARIGGGTAAGPRRASRLPRSKPEEVRTGIL